MGESCAACGDNEATYECPVCGDAYCVACHPSEPCWQPAAKRTGYEAMTLEELHNAWGELMAEITKRHLGALRIPTDLIERGAGQ